MDKKIIQEKRKKTHFIEATKKIVKNQGVKNLTVKKIAKIAGYAPGTLYNYFKNLDTLLFFAASSFFEDCKEYVLRNDISKLSSKEKAIYYALEYSNFFIENPNIYRLAFLEDIDIPDLKLDENFVPEIVSISKDNLIRCAKDGFIKKEDLEIILGLIANSIHGNILFFINKRHHMTKSILLNKIENEVKYILKT